MGALTAFVIICQISRTLVENEGSFHAIVVCIQIELLIALGANKCGLIEEPLLVILNTVILTKESLAGVLEVESLFVSGEEEPVTRALSTIEVSFSE